MKIKLLGVSINIKTDEDPQYIQEIVGVYASKIKELKDTTNIQDDLKLAIVSGILIAEQFIKENKIREKEKFEYIQKVNTAIKNSNQNLILEIIEEIDSKLLEIKIDEEED